LLLCLVQLPANGLQLILDLLLCLALVLKLLLRLTRFGREPFGFRLSLFEAGAQSHDSCRRRCSEGRAAVSRFAVFSSSQQMASELHASSEDESRC
jgi:hypothetical protein